MMQIEPTSLSPEEAFVTSAYLKQVADCSPDLTAATQSLFARCNLVWCSGDSLNELSREAGELAKRIRSHPQPDQLNLDPVLLIETYKIFHLVGIEVEELRSLLDTIAAELAAQPAEAQSAGRVRFIASQLASLGFAVRVAKPGKEMATLRQSPEKWFTASVASLAELADHLLADQRQLDEIEVQILALIALAELRNYRVDLGCALLRAVFHLGVPCPESIEAFNFIALQRRRDGRYGFANQFAEATEPDEEQHLSLYLPLTVNAVWLFSMEAANRRMALVAA